MIEQHRILQDYVLGAGNTVTILQNKVPELHTTGGECSLDCRRTCRCCGSSIPFIERLEIDQDWQPGLDVCSGCILHFNRRSCLENG